MTPLRRLLNSTFTFGGGGGGFEQPDFWKLDAPVWRSSGPSDREHIDNNFQAYVEHGAKGNGIVFACLLARQLVFSEVRFQYQKLDDHGRPGPLFGDRSLQILDRPSRTQTTGELLARMEQDATLAGNWFGTVRDGSRIRRLRPDWVSIITGSPTDDPFDIDAEVVGFIYDPRPGRQNRVEPMLLTADQVAHYSPIPDPEAQWRGMSWLTPVVREIMGDSAGIDHKLAFFKRGASPGIAISYDKDLSLEEFKEYVSAFEAEHTGVSNAYKTLHIGQAADVTSIGTDMRQLDYKAVMGSGETRIAAASGLGSVVAQLSEGLAGSALNAGNFAVARRRAETMLFRPLWRIASATLEQLVDVPDGARLTYDPRDVAFLRDDAKDEADIRKTDAGTIGVLHQAGYTPESITKFMEADGDVSVLEHSGLPSVQVQPGPKE